MNTQITKKAVAITIIIFILTNALGWKIIQSYDANLQQQKLVASEKSLATKAASLTQTIQHRFALLYGVRAFVMTHFDLFNDQGFSSDPDLVDQFLQEIYKTIPDIRNVTISPGGIHRHVYPTNENTKKTLGHNLLTDKRPHVQKKVQQTIRSKKIGLSGPYPLREDGSLGLIARLPIYQEDQFWGFTTMVLNVPQLLAAGGFSDSDRFSIRHTGGEEPFYGQENIFTNNPLRVNVRLPDGTWELAVPGAGDGISRQGKIFFFVLTFLIAILLSSLFFFLYTRRWYLQQEIAKATKTLQEQEMVLRESESRYRSLFENGHSVMLLIDPQSAEIVDVNPPACEFYGYPKDILTSMKISELNQLEEEELSAKMAQAKAEERNYFYFQHRLATGEIRDVEIHSGPIQVQGRQLLYSIVYDITYRKQIENELRSSKDEWERTFNSIPDIITIHDSKLKIIRANKAAYEAFPGVEIIGQYCYQFFQDSSRPCNDCPAKGALSTAMKHEKVVTHEAQGKTFSVSSSAMKNPDTDEIFIIHIVKDITLQVELESQLRQKYKMEAVGLMAGGIAHNFNNNLAIILGNIELTKLKLPLESEVVPLLNNAKTAILRSRDLALQILTYSRKGSKDKAPLQLSLIIDETLKLLRSTIPTSTKLKYLSAGDGKLATILADSTQIQEALINLCNNAVHSMKEKGEIVILLETLELQTQDIPAQYERLPGNYAKLSIKDTGCGIAPEIVEMIFDPFYTTKGTHEGTGMGLATVQGIVESHGGLIKVKSKLGQGSTFELYFPVIDSQHQDLTPDNPELPKGDEQILFIDDEKMLADIGSQTLREQGYQVTTETSSAKALALFKQQPEQFDLVITDQTMPEITGKELIQEIQQLRPDVPIILCTGYSQQINAEEAEALGINAYFEKPLDQARLILAVREVLDGCQNA